MLAVLSLAQDPVEPLEGRIIAVSGDRLDIAIDMGSSLLKADQVGLVKRDGIAIGVAAVTWVDLGLTRMRVLSRNEGVRLMPGDLVVFERGEGARADFPSTGSKAWPEGFVPLLGPAKPLAKAPAEEANAFHGFLRGFHLYQRADRDRSWYTASRSDSQGSITRLGGTPWSLSWSGNVSYRDASSFSTSDDFREVRPHVYRLTLSRKAVDGFLVRLGRFFPSELPGLGYVDGGQAELPVGRGVRVGAVLGARPDRVTQDPSGKELLGSAYVTLERGAPRVLYYNGTLGLLATTFRSKADELALVHAMRADLGSKLSLQGSYQVDFDAGGAAEHHEPRLTRANFSADAPVTGQVSLRAGADRYEPVDAAAERELARGTDYLSNTYWRYWVGGAQSLGWGLTLDEELSFTRTQHRFTPGNWRVGVSRRGLAGLPDAYLNATAYNLYHPLGTEYGSTLAAFLPFLEGRFSVNANASLRYGRGSGPERTLHLNDAGAQARWKFLKAWTADLGITRTFLAQSRSFVLTSGLTYAW